MFHRQPHLTHLLGYNDVRLNLSKVVHQAFLSGWVWVCMGVPFCSEVKEQLSNQGQTAVYEQAESLQLSSSPQAGIKTPAAKCKHPRQQSSSANGPVS